MRATIAALIAVLFLVVGAISALAAGSISLDSALITQLGLTKYTITWTSDGSGVVSANPVTLRRGFLRQVKFIPNGGGTQPSDLYDVTMTDANGVDVLIGTGSNLSNATSKIAVPILLDGAASPGSSSRLIFLDDGDYTPVVAAAGNAKGGTIILWIGGDAAN
jgi:hypothetical protein